MKSRTLACVTLIFFAFLTGICGVLLFRSVYNDFSIFSITYQVVGSVLGSAFFLTIAVWLGFSAFK